MLPCGHSIDHDQVHARTCLAESLSWHNKTGSLHDVQLQFMTSSTSRSGMMEMFHSLDEVQKMTIQWFVQDPIANVLKQNTSLCNLLEQNFSFVYCVGAKDVQVQHDTMQPCSIVFIIIGIEQQTFINACFKLYQLLNVLELKGFTDCCDCGCSWCTSFACVTDGYDSVVAVGAQASHVCNRSGRSYHFGDTPAQGRRKHAADPIVCVRYWQGYPGGWQCHYSTG